jgi:NADH-quinone oxidoreductase subunit G
MIIHTNSKRALKARRMIVELMLSDHPFDCLTCDRNLSCELQKLAAELGIKEIRYTGAQSNFERDTSSIAMQRDPNKCVLCRRCETMCEKVQYVGVLSGINRGFTTTVGSAFGRSIAETDCTYCGQCVAVCPTGALSEVSNTDTLWKALNDPEKYVVAQTAPAVRAALGEMFGMPAGGLVTGKMITALKRLGFNQVLDTNFAADVTIMEEGTELINRIKNGGKLPLISSCCPAWIRFIEHQYPDLLDHPSTCRSPQEMFGALAKTYMAEKFGIDPKKVVCVSIMPCISKKYEANRDELKDEKLQYVDFVLTTRELGAMIREAGISFTALPDAKFGMLMGESTGAADIFGTTGGVLEATLRTCYELMTNKKLDEIEFEALRGFKGIKEATVDIDGTKIKVAVAHGLKCESKDY